MSLTTEEKDNVLKGREAIDTYRKAHAEMYAGKYVDRHGELMRELLKGLEDCGFKPEDEKMPQEVIGKFFDKNTTYNIEKLGYKDMEDMTAKATTTEKNTFLSAWK